jgi:ADP-ribose pyrophosphatase YjhB (NUDIX family)
MTRKRRPQRYAIAPYAHCGWVEPYESPAEAAVREAREETGLMVNPIQLVDVFYRPAGSYRGTHALVAVVYLCETIE